MTNAACEARKVDAASTRPARPEDADRLYDIHRAAMRDLVERVYGPWDDAEQRRMQADWLAAAPVDAIEMGGSIVGAVQVLWEADRGYLSRIEVDPAWQRRGVGEAVLGELLAEADRRGIPMELDVYDINPAVQWYRRHGFESTTGGPKLHMVRRPA